MIVLAFLLVILSAVLHALWNFITKKVSGNLSVLYIGMVFACIIFLPFLFFLSVSHIFVPSAYPFLLATGIIHAFYFFWLSKAYFYGDISTVYPMARGCGVVGTTLIAVLILKENISLIGFVGILVTSLGIFMLGFKPRKDKRQYRGYSFALLVGLTIASYSIVDKTAVVIMNPIAYIYGLILLATVFLTPFMITKRRTELSQAMKNFKKYSLIIGVGSVVTYLIILFVFRLAQVSYVVAVRELSVAIGAAFGITYLQEPHSRMKIVGIISIVVGLIIIKLA